MTIGVETRNVCVQTGTQRLADIDLELPQRAVGVALGPPASGKSLLLGMLAGVAAPRSGQIMFEGQDITRWTIARRRRAGITLAGQSPPIFAGLTVEQQIGLPIARRRLPRKPRDFLVACMPELDSLLDTPVSRLSRRAQRLVDIAACLVTMPSLVLIDEPAVDLGASEAVLLIQRLHAAGITVLAADRYSGPMLEVADAGWLMIGGRIVLAGPAPELIADPRTELACIGELGLDDFAA